MADNAIERCIVSLGLLALLACDSSDVQTNAVSDSGWRGLLDWDAMPLLRAGHYRQLSSRDRDEASNFLGADPGNKDFNSFVSVCGDRPKLAYQQLDSTACDEDASGYVIAADDHGPGYVSRIWMTNGHFTGSGPDSNWRDERIRIYADDLMVPVYDGRITDWQSGSASPFIPPFTMWSSQAISSYVPISYVSKLRIELDELNIDSVYYYQVDLQSATSAWRFDAATLGRTMPSSSDMAHSQARDSAEVWLNAAVAVPAGATVPLLASSKAGTVQELRFVLDDAALLPDLELRAIWDDDAAPSIALPLQRLFGQMHGVHDFETLPMRVTSAENQLELSISLPMPFRSGAQLTLSNTSSSPITVFVHVTGSRTAPPRNFGHLHVEARQSLAPFGAGANHVVAEVSGRGKYLGTLLQLEGRADPLSPAPDPRNCLEGDEIGVIDGVTAIQGTGTEDFFNGAWYFDAKHQNTLFAALIEVGSDRGNDIGTLSAVRWHILHDAISFEESFRLHFEIGANKPATGIEYDSVAFYYLE